MKISLFGKRSRPSPKIREISGLRAAIFILLVALSARGDVHVPEFVRALEDGPVAVSKPSEAPDECLLAHIDVETTGLVPGYHEMIDIGIVMTDLEGKELDRLFLRIMPSHPERISPGAAAVNAFSVELWEKRGYLTEREAVERIVSFQTQVANGRQVLFVAYNAWFDLSFVDHLFRGVDRTWRELYHYFVLDLPSMLWSLGLRDLNGSTLEETLGVAKETDDPLQHTGITGAEWNVQVYRALLRYSREQP